MWLYSPSASPDVWRPDDCEPRPELCIDDRDPPASADVALSTCTSPMSTAVVLFVSTSGVQPNALQVANTTFWRSSTLERRPLAKVGFALSVALYLFAHAIAALSLATMYTTTHVWSLTIGTRSAVVLRSALVAGLLFVSAYVSGAPIAFLCGVLVGLLYATLN